MVSAVEVAQNGRDRNSEESIRYPAITNILSTKLGWSIEVPSMAVVVPDKVVQVEESVAKGSPCQESYSYPNDSHFSTCTGCQDDSSCTESPRCWDSCSCPKSPRGYWFYSGWLEGVIGTISLPPILFGPLLQHVDRCPPDSIGSVLTISTTATCSFVSMLWHSTALGTYRKLSDICTNWKYSITIQRNM